MNIEQQVCSLELAKRLKELGVKQDSYFWWVNPEMTENNATQLLADDDRFINCHPDLYLSAFTVAELGEMLPLWWYSGKRKENDYICEVFKRNVTDKLNSFGDTEANARAKMLIYLIENKLIEVPK